MDLTMMERVGDRWGKNGRILFDRPKPTVGCSASGIIIIIIIIMQDYSSLTTHIRHISSEDFWSTVDITMKNEK
jgi:hypothetical protein